MNLVHQRERHRFVAALPEGKGELLYDSDTPGVLDLYHAEVEPVLRGRGVAGKLVEAACTYARAHPVKLRASCPYVAWWFARHPEQQDLLAD